MSTSNESQRAAALEAARTLQTTLHNARLHILEARSQFDSKRFDDIADWPGLLEPGGAPIKDPAIIAGDVAAQTSFLNKLKFQYLEQNAKDKYVKTIVSDDPQPVTAHDKEELRASNEKKKKVLKAAKVKLAEKYKDIRNLAPFVEEDYQKAKSLTDEAASLSQKIVDARLALTRLRQAHPHPRLTLTSAQAQLDEQVMQMQVSDAELQGLGEQVARVKERVKEGARELEGLRARRAEVEKEVKAVKVEVEDERVAPLYEWFTASLAFMHSITGLASKHSVSENELRLTYFVDAAPGDNRQVTVTLLFVPNTRQLADVHVEGVSEDDLGDLIDSHIQANDAPGLIAAVLARSRLK
ncbi:hypothetical protein GLOTRDRAFT_140516 [Gloeophyllum trabeum ATCC 11539]|uniref:Kinetochore protein Sos7 coiled-coil domain-containing protein n=1 Tax=Gloeophyllum trabeum (strain ATCC 11539 / FP-39264 / Madison 617) TaxID=670483 RepID=S7PWQ7_GLOTA|nr:uncharacterized protein GLOTRDRAFT_140516 [Gloeophyllum trabeum ATCC 11539]EPQ52056.1 hypothetical protein GLOTRDRAFT_140516 [Gloeophyllum trabeum ATCC 11539]